MKKVAIVDVTNVGSTGKIARNLLSGLHQRGLEATFFYGRGSKCKDSDVVLFEHKVESIIHAFLARVTGLQGWFSIIATKRLTHRLKRDHYDTIIMISAHAYYLNESILFSYIAKENLIFINIMPDEYAYLGKCCNEPSCKRYKIGEGKCPNIHMYPNSWFFDVCSLVMRNKQNNYSKLKRARFVGPEFVINNLKQSYLGQFIETETLDETIDVELYKPSETEELRKKYCIPEDTVVILCVAPPYKGAHYYLEMTKKFQDNNKYFFIYIGKAECETTGNFLHIDFVAKDKDLAKFYSLADLFVFTSLRDTMPAACLEALACGTPIMVFNISGMPYILNDKVGTVVPPNNVEAMIKVVSKIQKKDKTMVDTCRSYALSRYDSKKYVDKIIAIANAVE